jgi:hypothetical protein
MATRPKIKGIPRTSWEAKRDGHTKANVNFNNMSQAQKKKWITIASDHVSHGDLGCIGPRLATGSHTVCYYDANTGKYDDCHTVPG